MKKSTTQNAFHKFADKKIAKEVIADTLAQIKRIESSMKIEKNTDLSATIRRAIKDPKEMTEQELERQRSWDDMVYHAMKEECYSGKAVSQ